jgi:Spy/CpxP family protein refolding chaperone
VSVSKVILVVLATLVIFSTGLITGIIVVKQLAPPPPRPPMLGQGPGWPQFLARIQGELDLTPEQRQRIGAILRDSQDRTRGFAGGEFRRVREQIYGELQPPQREKFEQLVKERQRRAQEMRNFEGRPAFRSNAGPMSLEAPHRPFPNRPKENPPPAEPAAP